MYLFRLAVRRLACHIRSVLADAFYLRSPREPRRSRRQLGSQLSPKANSSEVPLPSLLHGGSITLPQFPSRFPSEATSPLDTKNLCLPSRPSASIHTLLTNPTNHLIGRYSGLWQLNTSCLQSPSLAAEEFPLSGALCGSATTALLA
jgi:hypothetical protein